MKLRVISVGNKCQLGQSGFDEYAKQLPGSALVDRESQHRDTIKWRKVNEAEAKKLPKMVRQIGLLPWTRRQQLMARNVRRVEPLARLGRDIVFLIGGANGLSPDLLDRADQLITFRSDLPSLHGSSIAAECLYRAWTIHIGHPYHRDFPKAPLSE